jgi:hypothetical protein
MGPDVEKSRKVKGYNNVKFNEIWQDMLGRDC